MTDPALAARLLGVDANALLRGQTAGPTIPRDGTLLGKLFESLVTLGVRVAAEAAGARVRHLRISEGRREVDLIVVRDHHRIVAVEVKPAQSVGGDDVRHLRWLAENIGDDPLDAVVITTDPPWMKGFGSLADLAAETVRIRQSQHDRRYADWLDASLTSVDIAMIDHEVTRASGAATDHIRRTRLLVARQMLERSAATVGEVAVACGFCDQSQFTKAFKAHTGLPPQAYRRRARVRGRKRSP